jgi:hypothetical protein
VLKTSKSQISN